MPRAGSSEPAAEARTRDARLARARRIDWRVLLDTPDLGRAAVGGRPDALLRGAVGDALGDARGTERGPFPFAGPDGELDTVALSGRCRREDVATAVRRLTPDGRLVVEVDGLLSVASSRHGRPSPTAATRLARGLRAAGFAVRAWIAWPAVDRPTTFVDLDDPIGLRLLAERRIGGRGRGRIGPTMGRVVGGLAGRRLVGALAPGVVLVASRRPGPTFIERRLAAAGAGLLVLAPRYRASAHVIGLALAADGTICRVAKVARLADDRGLLHEAQALRGLASAGVPTWVAPTVLDEPDLPPLGIAARAEQPTLYPAAFDRDGAGTWPVLVETAIGGAPLDPAAVRRDRAVAVDAVLAWLAELPVGDAGRRARPISARLDDALATLDPLVDDSAGGRDLGDLLTRTRRAIGPLRDIALPVVFEHGDPAHPNLIRRPDGRVAAVDWERAEPDGLPLHDATIALAYLAAAAVDAATPGGLGPAFRAAMVGDDPWAAVALDRTAGRLGLGHAVRPALVIATWLRSAAWLVAELRSDGRSSGDGWAAAVDRPLDAGDAAVRDWLMTDRSTALWRVALDLAEAER